MQIFMYMAFSNYDDTAYEGAIMFGDSLLPSECSIIVEELKKTSLCFQVWDDLQSHQIEVWWFSMQLNLLLVYAVTVSMNKNAWSHIEIWICLVS